MGPPRMLPPWMKNTEIPNGSHVYYANWGTLCSLQWHRDRLNSRKLVRISERERARAVRRVRTTQDSRD